MAHRKVYRRFFSFVLITLLLILFVPYSNAIGVVDLLVTHTHDAGVGSLRQAIHNANDTSGQNTIRFNIPGDGPHSIALHSPLPAITDSLIIDGMTQSGANCESKSLMIELDGSNAGDDASGLVVSGHAVTVRGLVINRFNQYGIHVDASMGDNHFECNFIGTDARGTIAQGNRRAGIVVHNSPNNTIGGVLPGSGNLISGNGQDGVVLLGDGSVNNTVIGNLIGTDATGTLAIGNRNVGIYIEGASSNFVGGSDEQSRNIISGNGWEGVYIYKPSATHNIIAGNYIGTDISGTIALGNSDSGIVISQAVNNLIGGSDPSARNIISANGRNGIYIFAPNASYNRVIGNIIGTDPTGTQALGNIESGIYLDQATYNTIGGDDPTYHNLIASNGAYGIYLFGNGLIEEQIHSNRFGGEPHDNLALQNGLSDIYQDLQSHEHEA